MSSLCATTAPNEEFFGETCLLTPEGYGFSSPAERILKEANRGSGYYSAKSNAPVIDVMGGITEGTADAALVFDGTTLLGIFTESDYIDVSLFLDIYIYIHIYFLLVFGILGLFYILPLMVHDFDNIIVSLFYSHTVLFHIINKT